MADAILDSAEPVRAMIVVAGNPLLSIAGQERLRKAFEQLELLVVIDIYPSATAELAHVVLPCTDMYERDDLNIVNIGTSARPFAQYTPAVVAPAARSPAGVVDRPSPAAGAGPAVDPRRRARPTRGRSGATCCSAASASSSPTCRRRVEVARPARRRRRASSSSGRCDTPTAASTAARRCSPTRSNAAEQLFVEMTRGRRDRRRGCA